MILSSVFFAYIYVRINLFFDVMNQDLNPGGGLLAGFRPKQSPGSAELITGLQMKINIPAVPQR